MISHNQEQVKTILVLGGSGLIGSNFINFAASRADLVDPLVVFSREDFYSTRLNARVLNPPHSQLDLTDIDELKNFIDNYSPGVIINFAAHRDANTAEVQRGNRQQSAWLSNVVGVENLKSISIERQIYLIHISTDMIFAGNEQQPGPYGEDDRPESQIEQLSWYGWTKLQAEQLLVDQFAAIIRIGNVTQPIYDPSLDYVGKILYLYDNQRLYPLFDDQQLSLSYIPEILTTIERLIEVQQPGIYHVASPDLFIPAELAEYLIKQTHGVSGVVQRGSIKAYLAKFPNRYPQFGGLLATQTEVKLGIKFKPWREVVDLFVSQYLRDGSKVR